MSTGWDEYRNLQTKPSMAADSARLETALQLDPEPYMDAHHGKLRRSAPVCTSCKFWPRSGYSQNPEDYA